MATENVDQPATIEFWMSPNIERDYAARDVFSALRSTTALKGRRSSGRSLHEVSRPVAEALLEDARIQRSAPSVPRGLKTSFGRLIWALSGALNPPKPRPKAALPADEFDVEKYLAESRLKFGPTSPEAFRKYLSESFWGNVNGVLKDLRGQYGYQLAEDDVQSFVDAASEACAAIRNGGVSGKSLRERNAEKQLEAARDDVSLQRFLTSCKSMDARGQA